MAFIPSQPSGKAVIGAAGLQASNFCLRECLVIGKDRSIGLLPCRFRLLCDHTALMAIKAHQRKPLAKPENPTHPTKPSPSPNHASRLF